MSKGVTQYVRCPRCELNYILKKDKLCSVCKKEVEAAYKNGEDDGDIDLSLDFDICPVCKTNYISEDEDMCAQCAKARDIDRALHGDSMLFEEEDQDDYENDRLKDDDELGEMMGVTDSDDMDSDIGDLDLDIGLDDEMNFDDLNDDLEDDEEEDDFDDDDEDDFDDEDDDEEEDDDDFDDDDEEEDEDIKPKKSTKTKKSTKKK
ncbi:MAG: hypothetical protein IJ837_02815 [Clostridia bacterium]|nr:hypothetical protein [Clostridia bacterium]